MTTAEVCRYCHYLTRSLDPARLGVMTEHLNTDMDSLCLRVLDVLMEYDGDFLPHAYGRVLTDLATKVHGHEVRVGDPEYHRMSLVVLRLEYLGFVRVQRANKDESAKANVLERVTLL